MGFRPNSSLAFVFGRIQSKMFSSSAAIGWQLCQMAQVQVQIFLRLAIFEGLGQIQVPKCLSILFYLSVFYGNHPFEFNVRQWLGAIPKVLVQFCCFFPVGHCGKVAALYKEVCGTNFETPPKKVKQQDGHTILGLDRRQKLKITTFVLFSFFLT